MNKREYSDDEAREILKRAVDYQERDDFKYSRDQLFDLGRDMGLSHEAIVKAEQEISTGVETPVRAKSSDARARIKTPATPNDISPEEAAFRRERMSGFYIHFAIYLATIAMLFTINLITSGLSFPWFLFPAMGWGIGIVAHFMAVGVMRGDDYEDAFDEWLDNQETRQRRRQRRLEQAREE
jgi:hypothetical protein